MGPGGLLSDQALSNGRLLRGYCVFCRIVMQKNCRFSNGMLRIFYILNLMPKFVLGGNWTCLPLNPHMSSPSFCPQREGESQFGIGIHLSPWPHQPFLERDHLEKRATSSSDRIPPLKVSQGNPPQDSTQTTRILSATWMSSFPPSILHSARSFCIAIRVCYIWTTSSDGGGTSKNDPFGSEIRYMAACGMLGWGSDVFAT